MKTPNVDGRGKFNIKQFIEDNPFWAVVIPLVIVSSVATALLDDSEAKAPTTTAATVVRATVDRAPDSVETETFVIPEVFRNIEGWTPTETDCANLQSWFDMADNAHGNQSDVGAMRWLTDLMGDIDQRMSQVGCYG